MLEPWAEEVPAHLIRVNSAGCVQAQVDRVRMLT
jgi:hypothetical protein